MFECWSFLCIWCLVCFLPSVQRSSCVTSQKVDQKRNGSSRSNVEEKNRMGNKSGKSGTQGKKTGPKSSYNSVGYGSCQEQRGQKVGKSRKMSRNSPNGLQSPRSTNLTNATEATHGTKVSSVYSKPSVGLVIHTLPSRDRGLDSSNFQFCAADASEPSLTWKSKVNQVVDKELFEVEPLSSSTHKKGFRYTEVVEDTLDRKRKEWRDEQLRKETRRQQAYRAKEQKQGKARSDEGVFPQATLPSSTMQRHGLGEAPFPHDTLRTNQTYFSMEDSDKHKSSDIIDITEFQQQYADGEFLEESMPISPLRGQALMNVAAEMNRSKDTTLTTDTEFTKIMIFPDEETKQEILQKTLPKQSKGSPYTSNSAFSSKTTGRNKLQVGYAFNVKKHSAHSKNHMHISTLQRKKQKTRPDEEGQGQQKLHAVADEMDNDETLTQSVRSTYETDMYCDENDLEEQRRNKSKSKSKSRSPNQKRGKKSVQHQKEGTTRERVSGQNTRMKKTASRDISYQPRKTAGNSFDLSAEVPRKPMLRPHGITQAEYIRRANSLLEVDINKKELKNQGEACLDFKRDQAQHNTALCACGYFREDHLPI